MLTWKKKCYRKMGLKMGVVTSSTWKQLWRKEVTKKREKKKKEVLLKGSCLLWEDKTFTVWHTSIIKVVIIHPARRTSNHSHFMTQLFKWSILMWTWVTHAVRCSSQWLGYWMPSEPHTGLWWPVQPSSGRQTHMPFLHMRPLRHSSSSLQYAVTEKIAKKSKWGSP